MKFNLGEKVVYKNLTHTIFDYSSRYSEYTLKTSAGHFVYGVKESELEKF